jgi:DNA polymerase
LRRDPEPVTRAHGRAEVRVVAGRAVRLLPLFHPAAALYTRSLQEALRADFAQVPGLLALPAPDQPEPAAPPPPPPEAEPAEPGDEGQLGLF